MERHSNLKLDPLAMLYLAGQWRELVNLTSDINFKDSDGNHCYRIAALMQLGKYKKVKNELRSSKCILQGNRNRLLRVLASGVFCSISKSLMTLQYMSEARRSCDRSLDVLGLPTVPDLVKELRFQEQRRQLGLPHIEMYSGSRDCKLDISSSLAKLRKLRPDLVSLVVASAEYNYEIGNYSESLKEWQEVAALMPDGMPSEYYARSKKAYVANKGFSSYRKNSELTKGDVDKYAILEWLHTSLNPSFYLEIGVQRGKSLEIARCEAVGVDPMPILDKALSGNVTLIESTSDAFFESHAYELKEKDVDLIFIDGMHLFEYVLRDFINAESVSNENTVIVIDDIFPCNSDQAARARATKVWTGDVWKIYDTLKRYRKDLNLVAVDAYPTGLLCISGLKCNEYNLKSSYESIVSEYKDVDSVPKEYLERAGAITGRESDVFKELARLFGKLKTNS